MSRNLIGIKYSLQKGSMNYYSPHACSLLGEKERRIYLLVPTSYWFNICPREH